MKKLGLILLSLLTLIAVGAYYYLSGDDHRPTSTAINQGVATLTEKHHTVIYNPQAESNEVPMYFDRLDFGDFHRIEYFIENGYIGLSGQKDAVIAQNSLTNGFPRLTVLFPSSDMTTDTICQNGQYAPDLENSCPMTLFPIETANNYQIEKHRTQLYAQSPVHQTPPMRKERLLKRQRQEKGYRQTVDDDTVYQWAAFYTQKSGASKIHDTWLGWECDRDYLSKQNNAIHSWAEKDNLWPMPPASMDASDCAQPLSGGDRWKIVHFPKQADITLHPVLWECSQYRQVCTATFDYHGVLKKLTVQGGAIDDKPLKSLDSKRHDIVKTAWQTLQIAARRAESEQTFDLAKALQKDLAWCQQMAQTSRALLQSNPEYKEHLNKLWDSNRWAVSSYAPVSPCGRAMHRLIQHHDAPDSDISDKQAFDAIKQLMTIETQMKGDIDQPLNALYNHFAEKHYGEQSVEAFLVWADSQRIFEQPEAALEKYDSVVNQFDRLTPKQRIDLRLALAYQLRNKHHKVRARELMWLAAEEWILHPDTLDDTEAVSLLFNAAAMTRHSDIRRAEHPPKVTILINEMQRLAERIAADDTLKLRSKRVHLSTLGMHAAWHANYLATQGEITWIRWLDEWFNWLVVATKAPQDTPPWLQATQVHLEAAKRGEMTRKDCPGSQVSGCLFYPPYPPKH